MTFTRSHRSVPHDRPSGQPTGWYLSGRRATACAAGVAWLSHKRRLRGGSVVVADPMVEVVYGGGNAVSTERKPGRRNGGDNRSMVDRGRRGDRWNREKGTEGRTPSGRKRGNQEKPKWVSSQVTWRRTGPDVQDGDTLSYSSSGRSWPLQVLSAHSGNAS